MPKTISTIADWFKEPAKPNTKISVNVKYSLYFLNFLAAVCGIGMIVLAFVARDNRVDNTNLSQVSSMWNTLQDMAIALGVFGALLFLLAIFGTYAVYKEDNQLLKWFAGLTFLLIVILALMGIIAIIVYLVFRTKIKQNLNQSYIEGYTEDETVYNATNTIQKEWECCGVSDKGYKDWEQNLRYACEALNPDYRTCAVPDSCCLPDVEAAASSEGKDCGKNVLLKSEKDASELVYIKGCIEALNDWAGVWTAIVAIVAFVVMLVSIGQFVLTIVLIRQIKAEHEQNQRWAQMSNPTQDRSTVLTVSS